MRLTPGHYHGNWGPFKHKDLVLSLWVTTCSNGHRLNTIKSSPIPEKQSGTFILKHGRISNYCIKYRILTRIDVSVPKATTRPVVWVNVTSSLDDDDQGTCVLAANNMKQDIRGQVIDFLV